MKFGLLLFLLFILSIIASITTDGLFQSSSNKDGTFQKLRQKVSNKYRNLRTKLSNNHPRYQPPIVISDTSQRRLINQASTNNITHATVDNMYSTSSIAEDYCRNYGPISSVLLFAYRGSCYSLTNQAIKWSDADDFCQKHFQINANKNQGGLALFDDDIEYDYIRHIIGDFNRSATEFGAYIGFSYRNDSWLWLNGRRVDFYETPPSVIPPNNDIFPYRGQKPCGKIELLRPNESTILYGLMQQECTKAERALCKIKVDYCFENNQCGIHGVCTNNGLTFQCECTFLYDGIYCDKYSSEAIQVIIASLFITLACIAICLCKRSQKSKENRRRRRNEQSDSYLRTTSTSCLFRNLINKFSRLSSSRSECKKSPIPPPLPNPRPHISKRHRSKPLMDNVLIFFQSSLTITIAGISIVYICTQRNNLIYSEKSHSNKSSLCQLIGTRNSNQNIIILPFSILLTLFLCIIHQTQNYDKKKKFLKNLSFPIIVNPFQKSARFYTVLVFAVISNQLITLLYEILFSSSLSIHHGILYDLIRRLGLIILYGMRYFPILLSLNIQSFFSMFFTSIFLTFDLLLSVYFEANCVQTLTSVINFKIFSGIETVRIYYILFKNLPHYIALAHLTARFFVLSMRNFSIICRGNSDRWNPATNATYNTTSIEYDDDWYYTKKLLLNKRKCFSKSEYFYAQTINEDKSCSCLQTLIHLFYKPKAYFRYSLLVLFTYMVSFLVLYYLTCLVIFSSTFTLRVIMNLTGNILIKLFNISLKNLQTITFQNEIFVSSLLSFFIYMIQLLFGLKKYQSDMLNYYQGNYEKKKQESISSSCILQRSFHYSGYQVGYVAYGFVVINYLMFIVCLIIKIIFIHPLFTKFILNIIAPLMILFALKHIIVYCLTKYFFLRVIKSNRNLRKNSQTKQHDIYTEKQDQAIYVDSTGSTTTPEREDDDDDDDDENYLFTIENRHAYFIFIYFNFFFDCFLGVISCVIRVIKSTIAIFLFAPRLDYATVGRSLESMDQGYSAYTSYMYVEAMHTHPILITFTQIIYMNILDKRRREKHFLLVDEKQIIEQNRRKSIRFRWFLLITLMNNISLIPIRRHQRKNLINHHHKRPLSGSSLSNGTFTIDMCQ